MLRIPLGLTLPQGNKILARETTDVGFIFSIFFKVIHQPKNELCEEVK